MRGNNRPALEGPLQQLVTAMSDFALLIDQQVVGPAGVTVTPANFEAAAGKR